MAGGGIVARGGIVAGSPRWGVGDGRACVPRHQGDVGHLRVGGRQGKSRLGASGGGSGPGPRGRDRWGRG